MVQNMDKLAIVLSVAVITLVLMVQTTFASGAASVSGAAVSSSPLAPATHTPDGDFEIADASENEDDDFEIDDATDTPDGRGDKPIPPGQLKRRGIFGTVSATGTDDEGNEFVIIETKFGSVTVNVEESEGFERGRPLYRPAGQITGPPRTRLLRQMGASGPSPHCARRRFPVSPAGGTAASSSWTRRAARTTRER